MPKFEKSTGYKMKGSTFYGKKVSSKSPLKISDRDVVAAQAQLDKVETKFRQPGWAKAAYKVHKSIKNPFGKKSKRDLQAKSEAESEEARAKRTGVGGDESGGGGAEEKTQSVGQRVANTGNLEGKQTQQTKLLPSDYQLGDLGSSTSMGMSTGGGSPAGYRVRVDNKRKSPIKLGKQFAREQKEQQNQRERQAKQFARIDEAQARSAIAIKKSRS